ncbi:MAG: hypothetical protein GXO96_08960 [Nitrospirae bacterium]|nr:hypothetical protein [Candidatus Manganitrophaceae bacterium]
MKNWLKLYSSLILFVCFVLVSSSTTSAQQIGLRETLASAIDIIEHHSYAEIANLEVVSVTESQQHALKSVDRIAGYPVLGSILKLSTKKSQQMVNLILDSSNYANIRQRCKNDFFHGIRFSKEHEKIEVAIGIPCNQVLIVFHDAKQIRWWGGIWGDISIKEALKLLDQQVP